MATIENVADMLFSGLTSVAMGSYARTPPQAERTQSHRPQRGELLAEPALNVAGSISFRFHVVCVSYNTHTLQGFSSRTVSLSPHTKRQATSTQRQQKNWGWASHNCLLTSLTACGTVLSWQESAIPTGWAFLLLLFVPCASSSSKTDSPVVGQPHVLSCLESTLTKNKGGLPVIVN